MSETIHSDEDAQDGASSEIPARKKPPSHRDEILACCADITLLYDDTRRLAYIRRSDGDAIVDPIPLPSPMASRLIASKCYQVTGRDAKPQAIKDVMEALYARACVVGERIEPPDPPTAAATDAEDTADTPMDQYDTATPQSVDGEEKKPKKSQTKILVEMVDEYGIELFCSDGEAYARVPLVNGAKAFYRVRSRDTRSFLAGKYYELTGDGVRSQSMSDALATIEARALHHGTAVHVDLRIGHGEQSIHIDLCDDAQEEVCITPDGWSIQPHTRYFRRAKGMMALPRPVRGGNLSLLRRHINMEGEQCDAAWALIASWLVVTIATSGPYAILALIAEQGSAKSTIARMNRALVDPSIAPLVGTPREDRDLIIAANASYVIAVDNLSHIDGDLSDCLCCIATGGGYRTRELYTDTDETIISVCRPIILTAIENVISRGDLADRVLTVQLRAIPDDKRRDESEIWAAYEADRPRILGALYDAAAMVLRRRAEVRATLSYRPRMLDYAIAAAAAEEAYGVPEGTWADAHQAMRGKAHSAVLEGDLPRAVIALLDESPDGWSGTATELLHNLARLIRIDGVARPPKGWPADATRLSGALRRIIPALRTDGVEIDLDARTANRTRTRVIRVARRASNGRKTASTASAESDDAQNADAEPRDVDASRIAPSAPASAKIPLCFNGFDAVDAVDADFPSPNNEEVEVCW